MQGWVLGQTAQRLAAGRHEISGAFGDIGILIPLSMSLILVNGVNPTSLFLGVGLFYIAAGLYFRVPIPVQPMKAIAAIAVAGVLSPEVIGASGLLMGLVLLLLVVTGAIGLVARYVPVPVIKGIQLSLGLLLIKAGSELVMHREVVAGGPPIVVMIGSIDIPAGFVVAVVCLVIVALLLRWPVFPASVAVVAFGAAIGVAFGIPVDISSVSLGPLAPVVVVPSASALLTALGVLVLPQLPLSLGNAVLSTSDVAREYFGVKAWRVTAERLCLSMGIANLLAGLLAGMPMCHGAGGLTAHYRFGARTALANVIIGSSCLLLALIFGRAIASVLLAVPYSVLGALLVYVGWRHMALIAKVQSKRDLGVVLLVAAVAVLSNNLALGAGVGLPVAYGVELFRERFRTRSLMSVEPK